MAKQRFRDTKKGKVTKIKQKEPKEQLRFVNKRDLFKAILTDSFMLWFPIVYIVIYAVFGDREGFAKHMLDGWLYILVPLTIIEVIFLKVAGQTPGMRAYNLKLIFLPTKSKPPLTTIILRQILSKFTFLFFLWITIFFRKDSRNFHDLIVGTAIVYDDTKDEEK